MGLNKGMLQQEYCMIRYVLVDRVLFDVTTCFKLASLVLHVYIDVVHMRTNTGIFFAL